MSEIREYFTWEGNTLIFGDQDGYKWETTYRIIQTAASAVEMGGGIRLDSMNHIEKALEPEEVKEFVRIVCEVNGKIYTESRFKETKSKITVSDIKKTFDRFDIKIEVKDNK
jgi:phosphoribosylformimino-5-aminoimidazole carboxamide ribonucleotide (ProFAR) isomerase